MPVHVVEKLNKIVRSERKLRAELGASPRHRDRTRPDLSMGRPTRSVQPQTLLLYSFGDEESRNSGTSTDVNDPLLDEAETTIRMRPWSGSVEARPA
jgi:hypothetical protein